MGILNLAQLKISATWSQYYRIRNLVLLSFVLKTESVIRHLRQINFLGFFFANQIFHINLKDSNDSDSNLVNTLANATMYQDNDLVIYRQMFIICGGSP